MQHEGLKKWIEEMAQMCKPDRIVWIDGNDSQKLLDECSALEKGLKANGILFSEDILSLPVRERRVILAKI